jgi:hypothetical protein
MEGNSKKGEPSIASVSAIRLEVWWPELGLSM